MTYKVVKKTVPARHGDRTFDFNVTRYYATWEGREPRDDGHFADPFVEVWADGSVTLNDGRGERIFLYDDTWPGIIDALTLALKDKREAKAKQRADWLAETEDTLEFEGTRVDLSRRQVKEALRACAIELEAEADYNRPIIIYQGRRLRLSRTDLLDNVATGLCATMTADEWRAHYLRRAEQCYGGRLQEWGGLSVIDSVSDG